MAEEGFRHTGSLNYTPGVRTAKAVRKIYFTTTTEDDACRTAAEKLGVSYSEWTRQALRRAVLDQGGDPAAMAPFFSMDERAKARDQKVGVGVLTRKLAALRESVEALDFEKAVTQVDELMQNVRGK